MTIYFLLIYLLDFVNMLRLLNLYNDNNHKIKYDTTFYMYIQFDKFMHI